MQFWKFALFGITGDLASRKILPALSKFSSSNQNEVAIDLIGYSRSQPNDAKIQNILNESSSKDQHTLRSVNYVQGGYSDPSTIQELISMRESHEKMYIYLAVPPSVIIEFLQNAGSLLDDSIHLIVEKPFGRNSEEGAAINSAIDAYGIQDRVHFLDHYLFKTSVRIEDAFKKNFAQLATKNISKISVRALESLGVEDRKGYYNQTGAFKDMFAHLYSLTFKGLELFGDSIDNYTFLHKSIELGQYDDYLIEIEETSSDTNTYFKVESTLKSDTSSIDICLESGKKLATKCTHVQFTFDDDSVFEWNIAPNNEITYANGETLTQISTKNNDINDHENLYYDLLNGETNYFVSSKRMMQGWEAFNTAKSLEGCEMKPYIYKSGEYPIEKVS